MLEEDQWMSEDKRVAEASREREMEGIRVFLAEHVNEFVMGGGNVAVATPIDVVEVSDIGTGRRLRDYVEEVRRANEMFPRRENAKKKKKKKKLGIAKTEETVERQIKRANDMFRNVLSH